MIGHAKILQISERLLTPHHLRNQIRTFTQTVCSRLQHVTNLQDWNLQTFEQQAFTSKVPAKLPPSTTEIPRACTSWFIHDSKPDLSLEDICRQSSYHQNDSNNVTTFQKSQLNATFWKDHQEQLNPATVPLELTTLDQSTNETTFQQIQAPFNLLLEYLNADINPNTKAPTMTSLKYSKTSIYLAQHDIRSLPLFLQQYLETPSLVHKAGRGDLYASSLWLGKPPTYTPLHRDPNPNLFVQIAGAKVVRLFEPEVGRAVTEYVQELLQRDGSVRGNLRGEEMMQGEERSLLHYLIWGDWEKGLDVIHRDDEKMREIHRQIIQRCFEARLGVGEALFIPVGWWHSVKGVGDIGVTGSVNWWFR